MSRYIRPFLEIGLHDVGLVGGKTASLGELYSVLSSEGVAVPNGFAVTADAYRDALSQGGIADELHRFLDGLDKSRIRQLAATAVKAREIVYMAMDTGPLREQIVEGYRQLEQEFGAGVAVAVRSSATAEDLPKANFAGQHESFLNVPSHDLAGTASSAGELESCSHLPTGGGDISYFLLIRMGHTSLFCAHEMNRASVFLVFGPLILRSEI